MRFIGRSSFCRGSREAESFSWGREGEGRQCGLAFSTSRSGSTTRGLRPRCALPARAICRAERCVHRSHSCDFRCVRTYVCHVCEYAWVMDRRLPCHSCEALNGLEWLEIAWATALLPRVDAQWTAARSSVRMYMRASVCMQMRGTKRGIRPEITIFQMSDILSVWYRETSSPVSKSRLGSIARASNGRFFDPDGLTGANSMAFQN